LSDASQRDRESYGTDLTEVRHEPAAQRGRLRLYVAAMVLFPFVAVIFTLWWMTTGSYLRHAQYAYFVGTGYGSKLHGADCQVVVDGDSTALVGVLPRVIEQRTGLKTCNIAEVAGVKVVNGMMVLDDYLAHNRRPRFLLFLYAPENLTPPAEWTTVADFEGVFYRLRFHPDAAFWRLALREPNVILTDAELGLRTGLQWLPKRPLPAEVGQERERTGGRVGEPGEALQRCPGDVPERAPDGAWLAGLRKKYGVGGTQVLIDAMPEPPCDPSLGFYRARLKGVIDNTLHTLPIGDYNASGRLHTTDAGAVELSGRLAEQIAQRMAGGQGPASGPPAQAASARGGL
jgi:hypothetical protein